MKKRFLTLVLGITCSAGFAQNVTPAHKLFDEVLYLLDSFYDGYQKIDTKELKAQFLPKLDEICAKKDVCEAKDVHQIINLMLMRTGEMHIGWSPVSVIPPLNKEDMQERDLGIKFNPANSQEYWVIRRVYPGSPADKAGLVPGDLLFGINGIDFVDQKDQSGQLYSQALQKEKITLNIGKKDGSKKEITLSPIMMSRNWLPYLYFKGCVAVIEVENAININAAQHFHDLIGQIKAKNACGLIVDVRNNYGGLGGNAFGIVNVFTDKTIDISMRFKNSVLAGSIDKDGIMNDKNSGDILQYMNLELAKLLPDYKIFTKRNTWDKKIVLLTNQVSMSAAEYIPYMIQKYNKSNTCVIGEPTFGVLNTAMAELKLSDGTFLYMTGRTKDEISDFPERVTPDIEIKEDLDEFIKGNDEILNAGLKVAQSGQCSLK